MQVYTPFQWFRKFVAIGEQTHLSALDKRKLRIINGSSLLGFCVALAYLFYFVRLGTYWMILPDIMGLLVFALPIYFNAKHWYQASKLFAILGNYVYFAVLCVIYGKTSGLEYAFILAVIFPQFLFERKNIILFLAFLGYGCFVFFQFYYYPIVKSIAEHEVTRGVFFFNGLSLFLVIYLIVKQFKYENEVYLAVIEEQNYTLTQQKEEIATQRDMIELEKDKSDALLLNILPEEVAQELKETGQATPQSYSLVSVLFADFKGFTHIAEKLTPQQVIEELNTCFLAFDTICDQYGLEKIKTIGDCYMCAGGVPIANTSNPIDTVRAALEMQTWMTQWAKNKQARGESAWEVRIGIHSGEVIAGVVGKNKFAYDIWGDTVNLASRMESAGEVGKVNISGETYQFIKTHFDCTFRGNIQAKNKGEIAMYFVEKPK